MEPGWELPCSTHLSPWPGPTLGAPLPGSRRRAQPPGAAASSSVREMGSQDSHLCPSASAGLSPALSHPQSRSCLPVRGSRRQRKVPDPKGAERRAGTQAARPHPSSQRSPPLLPLPATDDQAPIKCKAPLPGGFWDSPTRERLKETPPPHVGSGILTALRQTDQK